MHRKVLEKAYALGLRKKGWSYNEIIARVPASKSTLSRWLRDADLSEEEREQVRSHTGESRAAGKGRVIAATRARREARDAELSGAMSDLFQASRLEPLFHIGLALYWANGSKTGTSFHIASHDSELMTVMLDWLHRYLGLSRAGIRVRLYLDRGADEGKCRAAWISALKVPETSFQKTVLKTGKRGGRGPDYKGSLRVEITSGVPARKMALLNRLFLDDYQKQSTVYSMRP